MADSPLGGVLYVDDFLSDMSNALQNMEYIADQIFPMYGVEKRSALIPNFEPNMMFRNEMELREPGTAARTVAYKVGRERFTVQNWALNIRFPDEDLQDAVGTPYDVDVAAVELLVNQGFMNREQRWADNFFKTGIWSTNPTISASNQWNGADVDAVENMDLWRREVGKKVGRRPNTLVLGEKAWIRLKHNGNILDRVRYVKEAMLDVQSIQTFLGIDRILVGMALKENDDGDEYDYDDIWNENDALLAYVNPGAGKMQPNVGYTFFWNPMHPSGLYYIRNFRHERNMAKFIEIQSYYDQKLLIPAAGSFLDNVGA